MALAWFSGAECGGPDGSGFGGEFDAYSSGGGGAPTHVTAPSPVRTGTYSVKVPHDGRFRRRTSYASSAATVVRFGFYIAANPSNAVVILAANNSTGSTGTSFHVWLNANGTLGWGYGNSGEGAPVASGATAVNLGAWNLIEVKLLRDAAAGGMEITLNGALQVSQFDRATTTGTSATATTLHFGNDVYQPGTNQSGQDMYFDDMAFGTGSTYLGNGGCLAFQGKAGAPTYDAWTKNGDTTAAACWSATPWSSAKDCSRNVVNDRQTMLLDDAAVAAAIAAADTINGAAVVAVGKLSSGLGNLKLTRRVGGVDTDTGTIVLSTTELFLPSGVNDGVFNVFTPTRADLVSGTTEVGAVCNSTNTEVVEDVWLVVDVTFAATPPDEGTPLTVEFNVAYEALTVEFMVVELGPFSALTVQFDVVGGGPEDAVGLLVEFDVYEAPEPGLTVTFDILPAGLVERRFGSDVQGPVADVDLT